MISKENLNYAIKNLWNRKVRSFLTILSIFVGITTIFIFISFGWGLFYYIDQLSIQMGVDKLVVQAKGMSAPGMDNTFKLTDHDLDILSKTRGIDFASAVAFTSAEIKKDRKLSYQFIIGMPTKKADYDFLIEYFTYKLKEGRGLEKGDIFKAVVGSNYMEDDKIFAKKYVLGDKINIRGYDFDIVGFHDTIGNPQDDSNIFISLEAYKLLLSEPDTNYAMLVSRVDNKDNINEIADRVQRKLRLSRGQEEGREDFFVSSSEDLIQSFKNVLNIIIGFIVLIALISVFVSAINTSNTMFTSILERTKEIGVIKAIGARNSEVLIIFLVESALLGFIGGLLGVMLGFFFSYSGGKLLASLGWGFLQPYYPIQLFIGCVIFATLVGAISGTIPAYNASKKNPVDSLRYE